MKVLDLFSGIGGFSLGLERAGFETVAFCEIEEYPRKVLKKHWPDVPIYEDVRKLTYERLRADGIFPDVITAGFPCQPYSRGNWRRKGRADDRDCVEETLRLVGSINPAVFIGENTEGFIDIGLEAFLDDLEDIGYISEVLSIPACAVGLPTVERHVWIISTPIGKRPQANISPAVQVINSLQGKFQRGDTGIDRRWDSPESRVLRVGKGVSSGVDRSRVKAIGNAIDPDVIELIGKALVNVD